MSQHLVTLDQSIPVSMLTTEVAERTGKRHDNVMRDTRRMLTELHGEGGVLSFEETLRNEQNSQSYPCFRLPKRELMVLVSGYSIPLRASIIDRLEELEAERRALPVPSQSVSTGDKVGAFIDLLVPKIGKAVVAPINGYTKKWVRTPLEFVKNKVVETQSYLEDRFKAMHERDERHIGLTEDVIDSVSAAREEVREIKAFITRTIEVPTVVVDTADFITIAEVQDLVGLPEQYRSRGVARVLSASAR